jgi:PAS domain S-box-containing protein
MPNVDNDAARGDPASGCVPRVLRCTPAVSDDAIVIVDNNGMITSWNPAAEKLLGYPADAAVGKSLALIIPPKHQLPIQPGFTKP